MAIISKVESRDLKQEFEAGTHRAVTPKTITFTRTGTDQCFFLVYFKHKEVSENGKRRERTGLNRAKV